MNVYVVLVLQMCVASGTHLVAKAVANDIEPFALTMLRNCIASAGFLALFFLRVKKIRIERADMRKIFFLGFLAIWLNQFIFLFGIRYTTAANAALLYASTPIFVMLISYFMKKERLTGKKIAGVSIAFTGIVVVIFERGIDLGLQYAFGNLVVLVSVTAYALYTILGRSLILKYGSLRVTILSMLAGVVLFLPAGTVSLTLFDFSSLTRMQIYGLMYLGFGTSIVSYILWYYALARIEATKVAIFTNGQPILTAVLAVMFFQQVITWPFVIGGAITISGVFLTQRSL
jgi:drug/metabolite transporter (DMT)-like permease